MVNIKSRVITNFSIYKIISKLKKSKLHAYKIGTELSYIAYLLYDILYNDEINLMFDNIQIYNILNQNNKFKQFSIYKYFSKNILYFHFFKKISLKLENINLDIFYSFIRGYYINEYILYSSNLNYTFLKNNYFVLYEFHPQFLSIIYNHMNKQKYKNKIKFLLNYDNDKYSINDYITLCDFKLIFLHKHKYYNNSIKNILSLFYNYIKYTDELYTKEDELLYNIYLAYLITNINY